MAALRILIGLILEKIEEVHDYIQVVFSDGTILNVFNNYAYDGGSLLGIEGKAISSVNESDSSVVIFFESGESLSIGLNDDDYNGPEAMVLRQDGKPPIVWN